jgi:hypothetical protein
MILIAKPFRGFTRASFSSRSDYPPFLRVVIHGGGWCGSSCHKFCKSSWRIGVPPYPGLDLSFRVLMKRKT